MEDSAAYFNLRHTVFLPPNTLLMSSMNLLTKPLTGCGEALSMSYQLRTPGKTDLNVSLIAEP